MLRLLPPPTEPAEAGFARSFGFAWRVVTLPDFPDALLEPYDDREEPYDPYVDDPEWEP